MYDWANSAFATTVIAGFFPIFFKQYWSAGTDPTVSTARLGVAKGASEATFYGLAGMGDLVLTCTGDLSRNRSVGIELGRGRKLDEILNHMNMVAEGVKTTLSAYQLANKLGVAMPITEQMYQILYEDKDPKQAVTALMRRALTSEDD